MERPRILHILARFAARRLRHVGPWLRLCHGAALPLCRAAAGRVPPRCARLQCHNRAGQAASKSCMAGLRPAPGPRERLQLGQFDRALVADGGRWRGRSAAGRFRPAGRRKPSASKTRAPGDRMSLPSVRPRPGRPRLRSPHRPAAAAAPAAPGARASRPSLASSGISARSRARVKRGSRLEGSSAKGILAASSVAISRDLGRSSRGADENECGPRAAGPIARKRGGSCRAAGAALTLHRRKPAQPAAAAHADQHRLGLIVERMRGEDVRRARLARGLRQQAGSARRAPPAAGRSSASGRSSAGCGARCRAVRASLATAAASAFASGRRP